MKFKSLYMRYHHYSMGIIMLTIGLSLTLNAQAQTQTDSSQKTQEQASATPSASASASTTPSVNQKNTVNMIKKHPRLEKIYTWKDANGITHITNTPPSDIISNRKEKLNPELITITGEESKKSISYVDRLKALENQQSEAKGNEEEALQKKRLKAQARLQCAQMKGRMQLYQSNREIRTVGSDGKDQVVSDSSRQNTLNALRESYSDLCR